MESPLMNTDASHSRAAKSNGTHRNPQRETKIACNSGDNWPEFITTENMEIKLKN